MGDFFVKHFETLLPLAVRWAAEEEERILREGVPLSDEEIAHARQIGIEEPQRVRLLRVDAIPFPPHPLLKEASYAIRFFNTAPRGLTLHHGIFVRSDYWRDRALIAHELAHTAQYQRLGGILPFLRKYLFECATIGYDKAPMEQEAIATAARVCGSC